MGGDVGTKAHWSLILVSVLTYAAICYHGVKFNLGIYTGALPSYEEGRLWGLVLALLYSYESLLPVLTPVTIFPRWQTFHLLKHHVPFTMFILYSIFADSMGFGDVGVFAVFRWTNCAILMTQGNEACETFQTLGGEQWIHSALGLPLPPPTDDVPGLVEKARLSWATVGVTQVAIAETVDIVLAIYRPLAGTGHWYYALHALLIVPAAKLHYTLIKKYWSRIARWQRAAWGFAPAKTE